MEVQPNTLWQKYQEQKDTDSVLLLTDEDNNAKEYHVHKTVLARVSLVFRYMFKHTMPDTSHEHVIDDVQPRFFDHIIKYAYLGEASFADFDEAFRVAFIAKTFKVKQLYDASLSYLFKNLTWEHCALTLSCRSALDNFLDEKAFKLVSQNINLVQDAPDFLLMPSEIFKFLLTNIVIPPVDKFKFAYKWAKESCRSDGVEASGKNVRTRIEPLLPFISFMKLSLQEFVCEVLSTDILNLDEVAGLAQTINDSSQKGTLPVWCTREFPRQMRILASRKGLQPEKLIPCTTLFATSRSCYLMSFNVSGIGAYGGSTGVSKSTQLIVRVQIAVSDAIKYAYITEVLQNSDKNYGHIALDSPFKIEANTVYAIKVTGIVNEVLCKQYMIQERSYQMPLEGSIDEVFIVHFDQSTSVQPLFELDFNVTYAGYY